MFEIGFLVGFCWFLDGFTR